MDDRLRRTLQALGIDPAVGPTPAQWTALLHELDPLLRQHAESLEEAEAWESIRRTLKGVIISRVGADGRILSLNRTADGSPTDPYVGVNLLSLFPPSEVEGVKAHIREVLETGQGVSFRVTAVKPPDGELSWWETDFCPIVRHDVAIGFASLTRDITARKRNEDALREREAENRALLEAIPDIIFRIDRAGTLRAFEPWDGFERIVAAEKIVGRNIWDIQAELPHVLPKAAVERGLALMERTLEERSPQSVEYAVETDTGQRSVEVRLAPLAEEEIIGLVRDVTERAQALEALRNSEEKTRALLDAVPDLMFLLSSEGVYLEWKPAKDFAPHVPPEDYLGRHVSEVLPEPIGSEWARLLREVRSGEVITLEYRLGDREYEGRLTACGSGALATIRDVTERKRSEADLRHSEALYANLFRHSTDGIVLHDKEGRILDINERAQSLFGYSKAELLGRALFELHPNDLPAEPRYAARRMNRDGVVEFETRYQRKDGEVFIAEVSASTFEAGGQRVVQSILRDVTERRRFEESLKAAKEEAERASRAKSQFLSNMSHELRTPLNAILGFGRVLDRGAYGHLNERQRQYLHDIIHSGEHMLELVNNLLDLRRLEERRDFIRPIPAAVEPLVDEAIAMVKPLVDERSHRFVRELPPKLPLALADERALVRVLVNLLSNAVKYTRPGGEIRVRVVPVDGLLTFEVHDSGVGIAPEHQTRIFNYFEQVRGTERLGMSGSGIGLALSRELVECMGGAIGVRSEPGRGSVFYFTLPNAGDDHPPHHPTRLGPRSRRSQEPS